MNKTVLTAGSPLVVTLTPANAMRVVVRSAVTGPRGLSAYEVAVAEGFEGTEQEWLETLTAQSAAVSVSGIEYDDENRMIAYRIAGNDYTVTYGDYGVETIEGGGKIVSYFYDGQGRLSHSTVT